MNIGASIPKADTLPPHSSEQNSTRGQDSASHPFGEWLQKSVHDKPGCREEKIDDSTPSSEQNNKQKKADEKTSAKADNSLIPWLPLVPEAIVTEPKTTIDGSLPGDTLEQETSLCGDDVALSNQGKFSSTFGEPSDSKKAGLGEHGGKPALQIADQMETKPDQVSHRPACNENPDTGAGGEVTVTKIAANENETVIAKTQADMVAKTPGLESSFAGAREESVKQLTNIRRVETLRQASGMGEKTASALTFSEDARENINTDQTENNFLNINNQYLRKSSGVFGIEDAKSTVDMPSKDNTHLEFSSHFHGGENSGLVHEVSRFQDLAAAPAHVKNSQADSPAGAVREVISVTEAWENRETSAVALKFDFQDGAQLSVHLSYRDGRVHAVFNTESHAMREAIQQEWQQQLNRNDQTARFADPVFSANQNQNGFAGQGQSGSRQNFDTQESGFTSGGFGTGKASSVTASEVAPVSHRDRFTSSHRLIAIA